MKLRKKERAVPMPGIQHAPEHIAGNLFFGRSHRLLRGAACPGCGQHLTAATAITEGPVTGHHDPRPGNATMCMFCGAILIFMPDMKLRWATKREMRVISKQPEMQALMQAHAGRMLELGKKPQ